MEESNNNRQGKGWLDVVITRECGVEKLKVFKEEEIYQERML